MQDILTKASTLFDVQILQIVGARRVQRYCRARNAVAYALRERGWSLQEIGAVLGARHHTTVMNSLDQAEDLARHNADYAAQIAALL